MQINRAGGPNDIEKSDHFVRSVSVCSRRPAPAPANDLSYDVRYIYIYMGVI